MVALVDTCWDNGVWADTIWASGVWASAAVSDETRGHKIRRRRVTQPRYKRVTIDGKTYEGTDAEIQAVYRSLEKPKATLKIGLLAAPPVFPIQAIPIGPELALQQQISEAQDRLSVINADDDETLLLVAH